MFRRQRIWLSQISRIDTEKKSVASVRTCIEELQNVEVCDARLIGRAGKQSSIEAMRPASLKIFKAF